MQSINKIRKIFELNQGMMRTRQLYNAHIFYMDIQTLIKEGFIEKIRYGYYQWIDGENQSEVRTVTNLFNDGIFCMDTALFFYRYSDRTPFAWHISISKDSNKSRFKIDYPFIKPYYVEPSILNLGAVDAVIDGNPIRIYDKERTICDCLRYMGKMDKELFNKAIRSYADDKEKDIPRLLEYAKALRVTRKVKSIIGVWL